MDRLCSVIVLALALSGCAVGSDVEETTAPSLDSHSWFPVSASPHRVDCNECHGAFATFSEFTCTDCHQQEDTGSRHPSVADYTWESHACYRCHPTGTADGVDHGPIFPIGAGTAHADATCTDCHANETDRKVITCTGCHPAAAMTPAHSAARGYAFVSATCLKCHADSQVDPVASHLPFRITGGRVGHPRESCLECHDAVRSDKPFPAADFTKYACLGCHADEHDGRYANNQCLRCHADGTEGDD